VVGTVNIRDWSPVDLGDVAAFFGAADYDAWSVLLAGSITLALVGTLDLVFALRAARNMSDMPTDQDRDLIGQGVSNIVTSAASGLFVSASLSLTSANYQAGGRTRISTLAIGAVLLAGLIVFPQLISSLPRVTLAAILV